MRSVDFGSEPPNPSATAEPAAAELTPEATADTSDVGTQSGDDTESKIQHGVALRPPLAAWLVVFTGVALLVVGALLPWAEATSKTASFSSNGIDGNGAVTLIAAVVIALVSVVVARPKTAARLVMATAALAGVIGVHDAVELSHQAARLVDRGPPGVTAGVGIGVLVTIAGAAIALVGGIVLLATMSRTSDRSRS